MSTETILLLLMIVFILGIVPAWPYSKLWGYTPTSILSIILVMFLIWAIAGGRPLFRSSGNIQRTVENAGQDLKSAGRDVADSIRDTVK